MEVNDNYDRFKAELESKIVKLGKSHAKILADTDHLRRFFAGLKENSIKWESSEHYIFSGARKEDNQVNRVYTWASGYSCKFYVQCRFSSIILGTKARVLLDKACRSPEEAARHMAISDADLTKKYGLKGEGVKLFRALVKYVLGVT